MKTKPHCKPDKNICPKEFCFNWANEGEYVTKGKSNNLNEALEKTVALNKGGCIFSLGKCKRIYKNSIDDFYEPNEPLLKNKGLPEYYFIDDINNYNFDKKEYSLHFAELNDLDPWIEMIEGVKSNFPGLETNEQMISYKETVIKNIKRKTALCVKYQAEIVGVLIFSYNLCSLNCMAVHPEHRRKGIASLLITKLLELLPEDKDVTVTTFRDNDILGNAPRPLYKKFGFIEDELTTEFDYPHQKFVLNRSKKS